jgi:hypothetical protein
VSVSTTFYPGANGESAPPDLVLVSTDSVFFYVFTPPLRAASSNNMNGILSTPDHSGGKATDGSVPTVVPVGEPASVLNVILHIALQRSCTHYAPNFHVITAALATSRAYGFNLPQLCGATTPTFNLLLSFAVTCPLELYALAAQHDLRDLAVATSPMLLSIPLYDVSDHLVTQMGPIYLKRLVFLHFGRSEALRRILLPPPSPHDPTDDCDAVDQKRLGRAWTLAAAYLAWDAHPDTTAASIDACLTPLGDHITCDHCKEALRERVRNLVVAWSTVKVSYRSLPLHLPIRNKHSQRTI